MAKQKKPLAKVFVKPAPGCLVHYEPPLPGFLKDEGEMVPESTYWLRRIRMVDVIKSEPPKAASEQSKTESPKRTKKKTEA